MQDSFKRGDLRPVDVAKYLVQDMIVGHIVKHDFEFFSIFKNSR